MTGEEEKALHSIMTISALIFIVMVMLLFAVIASPALSPVAAIADWDGDGRKNNDDLFPRDPDEWDDSDDDGVGDNEDAFPHDADETSDSDRDGIGDNTDFFDQGNGVLRISLDSFEFKGNEDDHEQTEYYPSPWFVIHVDTDNDGIFDATRDSEVFNLTTSLTDFFTAFFDVDDDATTVKFTVVAYDVHFVSTNNVTEYDIIDYCPTTGVRSVEHTIALPCEMSWEFDGRDDGDTPDCILGYSVATEEEP